MKSRLLIPFVIAAVFSLGCARPVLPPGQAKKVAGSKSARPFAPGQQKKMP